MVLIDPHERPLTLFTSHTHAHIYDKGGGGGRRGSSVGRARDFRCGVPGFDSRCGRPLPTGWVGVSIM